MPAPPCQGPHPNPSRPRLTLPPGTVDTHFHIFGPIARHPYVEERSFTPPEAPVERFAALMDRLGVARCVIVQPSVYGTINSCQREAMAFLGPRCRGVAVIDETFAEGEIEALHKAGFRGVRFNLLFGGGIALHILERIADTIAAFGWHLQLLIDGRTLPDLAPRLARLPVPTIIDHMGHMPVAEGIDHPGFEALRRLMREGSCWVKLSGAYRLTPGAAPYPQVAPLARSLIAANPDRVVWGTDWPHPALDGVMPDDAVLVDMVADWTDNEAIRRKLFAENAAAFYGFDTS
jgi:predicted TIM-barrel fold metal-dependent hydrolase